MSGKAKLTFVGSLIFTTCTIASVYWLKNVQFQNRRVGLERDLERRAKHKENAADYEKQ
ncbi:hypothetical protein HK097_004990, partial [Rhizophlyctis rosea]